MAQTHFNLSEVDDSDAQQTAQYVEVPAMQNGPLYRTMFPQFDTMTEPQKREIVDWYADTLEDASRDPWENLWKACSVDGAIVGFCGWTIIERSRKHQVEANNRPTAKQRKTMPEAMNLVGWDALSRALRAERDRVLKDLDNICRQLSQIITL